MTVLGKFKGVNIDVVATGVEKYISFRLSHAHMPKLFLRFIDSYQFMNASLDTLVKTLDPEEFHILKQHYPIEAERKLLTRKGVYPYEYVDSFTKFQETQLPPIEAFHSTLLNKGITKEDHDHAKNVWNKFGMRTLGDYHNLYLMTDVLLLADVFEKFRDVCLEYYEIDPVHLITAPSLAWQACLKMCDHPLELFTDLEQHLFIERGIRGGVSMISHRFARANNPQMEELYDPAQPNSYLMYIDANNLYGWSMSQYLPYGGFQWVSPEDVNEDSIMAMKEDQKEGMILEVDLAYPTHLHDHHNDFPLAAEKLQVDRSMLSPYAQDMLTTLNMERYAPQEKLTPNLLDKSHYVVHYRNLQYYLSQGLKLTKVHKVLRFNQSPWLKKYIAFNTEKRRVATSAFEKTFFKLMNNAVYGKTMENLRNRVDIQLVNTTRKAEKLVAAPSFKASKIFENDLVGVERVKRTITLNRPVYAGFVILELSKLHMYRFHYDFIKGQFGDDAKLCFTDTDSLTYLIRTDNLYDIFKQHHKQHFDFSDYPVGPYRNTENQKMLGKFKDELNGKIALEFVGLRAKMYSLLTVDGAKKSTAKGITRVAQQTMGHQDYKEALETITANRATCHRIGQEGHQLFTYQQSKIALCPFDDKRYILEDGIHTLAYGHYKIPRSQQPMEEEEE